RPRAIHSSVSRSRFQYSPILVLLLDKTFRRRCRSWGPPRHAVKTSLFSFRSQGGIAHAIALDRLLVQGHAKARPFRSPDVPIVNIEGIHDQVIDSQRLPAN